MAAASEWATWMRRPPLTVSSPVSNATSCEPVLADPGRRKRDPLGFPLLLSAEAMAGELFAQFSFKDAAVHLVLAQQEQLAAVLQPEEGTQLPGLDSLGAGGLKQQPVEPGEAGRVVPQDCAGQDIEPAAV